jgi:hypothetical protein
MFYVYLNKIKASLEKPIRNGLARAVITILK